MKLFDLKKLASAYLDLRRAHLFLLEDRRAVEAECPECGASVIASLAHRSAPYSDALVAEFTAEAVLRSAQPVMVLGSDASLPHEERA